MSQRTGKSIGIILLACAVALPAAHAQEKKKDFNKQLEDALKELDGKPKAPEAAPDAPLPDARPELAPRRNPFQGRVPANPFGANPNIFRDLEMIQRQIEIMNRVFDNLDNPAKQGEAVEQMRKQLEALNRRNGGGQPDDPVELMLKQIDLLNKMNNDPKADPLQLFGQQMQLLGQIEQARNRNVRPPARLGVRLEKPGEVLADQLNLPAGKGLVLREVLPGTVAAKAGLQQGDILLEWGGAPIPSDIQEFQKMVTSMKADEPFDVVFMRRGRKDTIKGMTLASARPAAARPPGIFGLLP